MTTQQGVGYIVGGLTEDDASKIKDACMDMPWSSFIDSSWRHSILDNLTPYRARSAGFPIYEGYPNLRRLLYDMNREYLSSYVNSLLGKIEQVDELIENALSGYSRLDTNRKVLDAISDMLDLPGNARDCLQEAMVCIPGTDLVPVSYYGGMGQDYLAIGFRSGKVDYRHHFIYFKQEKAVDKISKVLERPIEIEWNDFRPVG